MEHHRDFYAGEFLEQWGVFLVWLVLISVLSLVRPDTFPTVATVQAILSSQAVLLIVALGLITPLAAGELDLSISGVVSISLVLIGWLNVVHGWPIGAAVLTVLVLGLFVGLVNAFLVVVVGVDSIIVTLGTGTLLAGTGVGISVAPVSGVSGLLVGAVRHQFLGISLAFYYGLGATIVLWYIFSCTPLGRYLYFVGAGRDVARLSGIRVDLVRTAALVTSATMSSVGGIMLAGWLGAADSSVGTGYLLPAFAAAFLGASTLVPGRFNPWGTFVAVYFLVTGTTGFELLGQAGWSEQVFYGSSLVAAVVFSRLAKRRRSE